MPVNAARRPSGVGRAGGKCAGRGVVSLRRVCFGRRVRQQGIAQVNCAAHFAHRNINSSQFTSQCVAMHHGSSANITCQILDFLPDGLSLNINLGANNEISSSL